MSYKVAVVGATGNVGREMLNILAERQFPASEVVALASRKSLGQEITFGDKTLICKSLDDYDFRGTDIALLSAGGAISAKWGEKIGKTGCVVIDNSSHFRMDPDVPLIVPEVNPHALSGYTKKNIIANPNCSTAQMMVALKPLHDAAVIKRCVVSTYQSVSGSGKDAMEELWTQTRAIFVNDPVEMNVYPKQIAFNVIPHIDVFMDSGDTKEEWKMVVETGKILDPDIRVTATCVRVPVFLSHSESINLEFKREITVKRAREILREAPGIMVIDKREDGGYITPIDAAGEFATYISRIRKDETVKYGLNLWCVSDNLLKGAALNAVQVAELLCSEYLSKQKRINSEL
ncbi:MAG: aspartate-semialdehyde dehydrogenase [Kordiimonadaceae bacterium]|jgi:aspartate-semialdehyde dehydrogenase|nr:aspartate-semialdehyde dehydrogenase [Kordiimonadaceae bacterium]